MQDCIFNHVCLKLDAARNGTRQVISRSVGDTVNVIATPRHLVILAYQPVPYINVPSA